MLLHTMGQLVLDFPQNLRFNYRNVTGTTLFTFHLIVLL